MNRFKEIEIGQVAKFVNGFAFKPTDWAQSGAKIIRIQNLTNADAEYNFTNKIVPEKYLINNGDILVSWSATIDVFEWNRGPALLNQHIFKVELNKNVIDKDFFVFSLKHTINDLTKKAHGSTMKHVTKGDFESHLIPLPSLQDQIKIATLLRKTEDLIQKRKESIDLLDELVRSTFLEMFGDPVSNPKNWKKNKLSDYAEVKGRVGWKGYKKTDLTNEGPLVLGATHISENGKIDLSKPVYLSNEKFLESPEIVISEGDLLFVQRGNTIGKVGLVNFIIGEATINPVILIIRPTNCNAYFLLHHLMTKNVRFQMENIDNSSAQPMITQQSVREYSLLKIPFHLQQKFGDIAAKVDKERFKLVTSLTELEKLFNSLSQRAFNGELDLSKVQIDHLLPKDDATNENLDLIPESKTINNKEERDFFDQRKAEIYDLSDAFADAFGTGKKGKEKLRGKIDAYLTGAQISKIIQDHFTGFHFTAEMLQNFLKGKNLATVQYTGNKELRENPKVDSVQDIPRVLEQVLHITDPEMIADKKMLKLEQVFYNGLEPTFELQVRSADREFLNDKSPEQQSGIYFKVKE